MFGRLGGWCHDHRRIVVVGWVLAIVIGNMVQGAVGSNFRADFSLPDVESRQGFEILDEHFGGQGTGESGSVVFRAEGGVEAARVKGAIEPFLAQVAEVEGVARVVSPYTDEGANQISTQPGTEGEIGYAVIELDSDITFENAVGLSKEIKNCLLYTSPSPRD